MVTEQEVHACVCVFVCAHSCPGGGSGLISRSFLFFPRSQSEPERSQSVWEQGRYHTLLCLQADHRTSMKEKKNLLFYL